MADAAHALREMKDVSPLSTGEVVGLVPQYARVPDHLDILGVRPSGWGTTQEVAQHVRLPQAASRADGPGQRRRPVRRLARHVARPRVRPGDLGPRPAAQLRRAEGPARPAPPVRLHRTLGRLPGPRVRRRHRPDQGGRARRAHRGRPAERGDRPGRVAAGRHGQVGADHTDLSPRHRHRPAVAGRGRGAEQDDPQAGDAPARVDQGRGLRHQGQARGAAPRDRLRGRLAVPAAADGRQGPDDRRPRPARRGDRVRDQPGRRPGHLEQADARRPQDQGPRVRRHGDRLHHHGRRPRGRAPACRRRQPGAGRQPADRAGAAPPGPDDGGASPPARRRPSDPQDGAARAARDDHREPEGGPGGPGAARLLRGLDQGEPGPPGPDPPDAAPLGGRQRAVHQALHRPQGPQRADAPARLHRAARPSVLRRRRPAPDLVRHAAAGVRLEGLDRQGEAQREPAAGRQLRGRRGARRRPAGSTRGTSRKAPAPNS